MSNQISVPALNFAKSSGEALAQAEQLAQLTIEEGVKVAEATPGLVDRLVSAGLLDASEKSAAVEKLGGSHHGALEVLTNLLDIRDRETTDFRQKLAAAGAGRSVETATTPVTRTKDASAADLLSGGYVGRQRGAGEVSGADAAMAQVLGVRV